MIAALPLDSGVVENKMGALLTAIKARRIGMAAAGIIFMLGAMKYAAAGSKRDSKRADRSEAAQVYFKKASQSAFPIRYVARSRSYDLYISREEADVVLHGGLERPAEAARGKVIVVHAYANVLRMRFVDAEPATSVEQPLYQGRRSLNAVVYRGIYPGTDALLRANRRGIALQLQLSPGADAQDIILEIRGATSIDLGSDGNALVHAGREVITLERPTVTIQAGVAERKSVGAYEIEGVNRLRLVISGNLPAQGQPIEDE